MDCNKEGPLNSAEAYTKHIEKLLGEVLKESSEAKAEEELKPLREKLAQVRKIFEEGLHGLVPYEQRRLKEVLTRAEQSVDSAYKRLKPRQRFRFNKASEGSVSKQKQSQVEPAVESKTATTQPMFRAPRGIEIRQADIANGELVMKEVGGKDVNIEDVQDARIVLLDIAGALRITNATNVTLQAAGVNGSVLLRNATQSSFYMACRQLRVHDCVDCSFWLHSGSGPVIERCKDVRFGKGVFSAADRAGLTDNLWDQVKDFSDLRQGTTRNWQLVTDQFMRTVGEEIFTEYYNSEN